MSFISEEALCAQVIRLSVLRNRPDCIDEVIFAFKESAKNENHLARIAAWILKQSAFFPTPAEVYDAAVAAFREEDLRRPTRDCPVCEGTGYEQVWVLETKHHTPNGGAYVTTDRLRTKEQAERLRGLIKKTQHQTVYDGVTPCTRCQCITPAGPSPQPVNKLVDKPVKPRLVQPIRREMMELVGMEEQPE